MIETVALVAAVPLAAAGLLYSASVRRYRALQRGWRDAARRAGLTNLRTGPPFWFGGVTASAGELDVRLASYQRGKEEDYERGTWIAIRGDSDLTLRPETPYSGEHGFFREREIELGDDAFDDRVWVLGSPKVARAVLDAGTRKELVLLLSGVIRVAESAVTFPGVFVVEDGELRAEIPDRDGPGRPEALASVLKTLLAMARKLQRPADIVGRIVENARSDPEWGVRARCLRLLSEDFPRHPRLREALERGCADENEEVQLVAGLALGGQEGRRMLLEIATRDWSSDDCAALAVHNLGAALPQERLQPILAHALRTRRIRTAEACLGALGRTGGTAVVEPLAKVLAIESGELGVAAALALGASRAEGAEDPLLHALTRASMGVREAAAEALGHVGTARAVLPLKEVAVSSGGSFRRAARQAVGEIQARLQGVASPGQLSLAGGETGQLSLAEADTGQLSLAEGDRRGRVSIAGRRTNAE